VSQIIEMSSVAGTEPALAIAQAGPHSFYEEPEQSAA
jgi:hypothetical protein